MIINSTWEALSTCSDAKTEGVQRHIYMDIFVMVLLSWKTKKERKNNCAAVVHGELNTISSILPLLHNCKHWKCNVALILKVYIYICSVTRTEKQDWATFDQNFLFKGVYKTDFFYYMFFVRLFLTFLPLLNHTQNNNNKNKSNKYIYIVSMEKRGSANMCDPKIAKWKRIVKKKNSFRFVREA